MIVPIGGELGRALDRWMPTEMRPAMLPRMHNPGVLDMRKPGWVAAIVAVGVAGIGLVLWLSFSERGTSLRLVSDDPNEGASPSFEPSTMIRATFKSSAELYCPDSRPNCCDTWVTDYATHAPITVVVDFFERLGFRVRGQPGVIDARGNISPGGELVRWAGDRGAGSRWRKVDISTGEVFGLRQWPTVVEVFAAACSSG